MNVALFTQILNMPFAQFWLAHPFLAALAVFCCVFLFTTWSAVSAMRRVRPARSQESRLAGRPPSQDDVVLVQPNDGVCQDVSAGGMVLELPFPLKVRTRLDLPVSEAKLPGASFMCR